MSLASTLPDITDIAGLTGAAALGPALEGLILAGTVLLLALAAWAVVRLWVLRALEGLAARASAVWVGKLVACKVFAPLAWMAPLLVLHRGLDLFPAWALAGQRVLGAGIFVVALVGVSRFMDAALAIYDTTPVSARRPMKGYAQLVKLFLYLVGAVVAVCLLLGTSPWGFLSGIGALTAVLLLVFRDTILSLVASVQLVANDLVRKGDWIEMPAYGVDGDVEDIALHTVKVRNFDKTIVTVPTERLISESFRNWRGMAETGARRVKRAVSIDQTSVRFLSEAELDRLEQVDILAEYVRERRAEIAAHNRARGADREACPLNGRGMTNLGTFRAYVRQYLLRHPRVRTDMTLLVRQLAPGAGSGLPLEIYCFVDTTVWAVYEDIQSDLMDHILAALPQFGLRAYQRDALADARVRAG